MCGIAGLYSHKEVNQELFDALTALQHRGQDAAGIMTTEKGQLFLRKGNGLVRDVFHTRHMLRLKGKMGLGHVRYPTAGSSSFAEAQPFYVNSPYGICLAHNGNLTNAKELAENIFRTDLRHLNTSSDSEVLLNVFAHELQEFRQQQPKAADIFAAVAKVHERCRGAYAVVCMIQGHGMLGFRDANGIRPLVYGKRETEQGTDYMLASESVALNALGFTDVKDVRPGEAIFIDSAGQLHQQQCASAPMLTPCIFEYVYLARTDSVIDDISVYKTRLRMGDMLAEKIKRDYADLEIDVVMPIPDTSRTSASRVAQLLNIEYREGFVKNRYIGRTFIMPGQLVRKKSVQQKLNAIDLEFKGKNVLLIDDSIVRGTTCQEIIRMARTAGAKNVYFASAAPPIRFPNVYGIDMPSRQELIAYDRTEAEICALIGADALIYQELKDLIAAAKEGNPDIQQFDTSVFTGEYITGDVDVAMLEKIEAERNDLAMHSKAENNSSVVDLLSY
jgi:amidophosphoribosyltransferase